MRRSGLVWRLPFECHSWWLRNHLLGGLSLCCAIWTCLLLLLRRSILRHIPRCWFLFWRGRYWHLLLAVCNFACSYLNCLFYCWSWSDQRFLRNCLWHGLGSFRFLHLLCRNIRSGTIGCRPRFCSRRPSSVCRARLSILLQYLLVPFSSLDLGDVLLQARVLLLIRPDLPHHIIAVPRVQPLYENWQLLLVFLGLLESWQSDALYLPLLRDWLGAILRPIFGAAEFIAEELKVQIPERVGCQSGSVVSFAALDQVVVREQVGDARERLVLCTVCDERLE